MENQKTLKQVYEMGMQFHHYTNTAYPLTPRSLYKYELFDKDEIYCAVKQNIQKQDKLNLYVHIPFCASRCRFCEYVVLNNKPSGNEQELYTEALIKEIRLYKELVKDKQIVGFDMGGGTPTFLDNKYLEKITNEIKTFNFKQGVVWSIETTPVIAANDFEKIKFVKQLGYERISMGFQTVSKQLLESLGREGSEFIYEKAVKNIRKAGYTKLNIDLMYGFLNQSDEDFVNTIKYTIALNPEYITLYRNRYKGTKLESESQGVALYKVNHQYELAYNELKKAGYVANNGKNTFSKVEGDLGTSDYLTTRVVEARSYIGFGLGAQSFVGDYLAYNLGCDDHKLERYIKSVNEGVLPINDIAVMPKEEVRAKALSVMFYFGFISQKAYKERFNEDFKDVFKEEIKFLQQNKLMDFTDDDTFMLTDYGAEHLYGIIPLFYSQRSKDEMFTLASKILNKDKGEQIYLDKYDITKFDRPSVAVDIIVFNEQKDKMLFIKRLDHPYVNSLALVGGFYRPDDETVEHAAVRELQEEANICLDVSRLKFNKTSSTKGRDPRGWIISLSYVCCVNKDEEKNALSGSDAGAVEWVSVEDIDNLDLAFDHKEIVKHALSIKI